MLNRLSGLPPTAWVTIQNVTTQVLLLAIFAIQAPLLGPHAFGLFAIAMIFVGLWELIPGMSTLDALISVRTIEPLHYSTATIAYAASSLLFGLVLFAIAGGLGATFKEPDLPQVVRLMAAAPLIGAFSIAPTAAARRDMHFRAVSLSTFASILAGGGVGLTLALAGDGVSALAWQAIVQRFASAVALWLAVPARFQIAASRRHLGDVMKYVRPLTVGSTMNWAAGQVPRLILGYYLGATELGLFALATRLNEVVTQVAIQPKSMVARVHLRLFADDPAGLADALHRVLRHTVFITFPLCIGGAAVTPTVFHAWLNPSWHGAIIPAQLILLTGLPYVTFYATSAVLLAVNRQAVEAAISSAHMLSILIFVLAAAPFGIRIVAAALVIRAVVMLPVPLLALYRSCGIPLSASLAAQMPALLSATAMGAAVWLLGLAIPVTTPSLLALSFLAAAGVSTYGILVTLTMPSVMATIRRCAGLPAAEP
jgi:PST family polysaccharide transporter